MTTKTKARNGRAVSMPDPEPQGLPTPEPAEITGQDVKRAALCTATGETVRAKHVIPRRPARLPSTQAPVEQGYTTPPIKGGDSSSPRGIVRDTPLRTTEALMQYRVLGRTGLRVSALGFGTMRFKTVENHVDQDYAVQVLHRAMDLGVNYFDSAVGYCHGESEATLGKALKGRREGNTISTNYPTWEPHTCTADDCRR